MSQYRLLCIYLVWSSLNILNLDVHFLPQSWTIVSSSKLSVPFSLSVFSFWNSHNVYVVTLKVSYKFLSLSSLFFILSLFCNFKWLVSEFSDSFLRLIELAIEPLYWIFKFSYCILQFSLVLFLIVSTFVDILILFMHHFPDFV